MLGVMYENGEGTPQNTFLAAKHYQRVAARGSDIAQFNLAAMYYEGRGVLGQWSRAQKAAPYHKGLYMD